MGLPRASAGFVQECRQISARFLPDEGEKIERKSTQNCSKIDENCSKMGLGAPSGGCRGPLGGVSEKRQKKSPKKGGGHNLETGTFFGQNRGKMREKKDMFFSRFFHAVSTSFWGGPGSQNDAETHLGASKKVTSRKAVFRHRFGTTFGRFSELATLTKACV